MMAMHDDPEFRAWVERARRGDMETAMMLCGFAPTKGSARAKERVGPCPACGGRDRFSVNVQKRKFYCRRCEARGGDALALALVGARISFVSACETLSREPKPARVRDESPEERAAREARRAAEDEEYRQKALQRARDEDAFRQREREACRRDFEQAELPSLQHLGRYFAARGIALPATAELRQVADMPFYHNRGESAGRSIIHRGPCMLARMVDNNGVQVGLHRTWLAPDWRGKAAIRCPDTGEALNVKKMRGTSKAAHIVLRQVPLPRLAEAARHGAPVRLFLAEGIETCASVATALKYSGQMHLTDMFWAAGSLGVMGGPALGTVLHPSARDKAGRRTRTESEVPDMAAPGIDVPWFVSHLVLLGDGDSDQFVVRMALRRAMRRALADRAALRAANPQTPDLKVRLVIAPEGMDFNDLVQRFRRPAAASAPAQMSA